MLRSIVYLIAGTFALSAAPAPADDFRMESKVYVGDEQQPAVENTTLFRAGRVYDYLGEPARVAIFDPARRRFILLDEARRLRTEVATEDVLAFSMKLQSVAAQSKNKVLIFAANPKFTTNFSTEQNRLDLSSQYFSYSIEGATAPNDQAAEQIREFSDWYARLNSMLNPGATPPFARLVVNEELKQRKLVAKNVSLTLAKQAAGGARGLTLHSEHQITWRLLPKDRDRLSQTADDLATFKSVSFAAYREPPATRSK